MKFTTLFYAVKARSASDLKSAKCAEARRHTAKVFAKPLGGALETATVLREVLKRHPLMYVAAVAMAAAVIPNTSWAQAQPAPPLSGVLGKVQSFNGSLLDVATPSGVVHVTVTQPLATYKQIPSNLSHVTSNSYVGVPSVQQADGTEAHAKQVIIFPQGTLRGRGGRRWCSDGCARALPLHSRMTNGSVSKSAVSHSRMTNGSVEKGGGSALVVRYQDGSQTISIPAGVQVTLVAKETVTLGAGDIIYAPTEKLPDGTLTTNKVFQFVAASTSNAQ